MERIMTDTALVDWTAAFDRYRETSLAMLISNDQVINAASLPDEVDPALSQAHMQAGMALLHVPARHLLHVAQKVRVAETLFRISQHHFKLVEILLDDLFSLAGLNTSDAQPLPTPAG
jgi:hypothetical protein